MKKFIGLLSILLGLLSTVHAQDLPLDPKCKYGVLGNGLTYYIYSHDITDLIKHCETVFNRSVEEMA